MNVDLSPELEQFVQNEIRSGRYNSESDVVREALVLLGLRDEAFSADQAETRKKIEEGWLSARRGELVGGDEVFNRIYAELDALERSGRRKPNLFRS